MVAGLPGRCNCSGVGYRGLGCRGLMQAAVLGVG